MCAYGYGLFDKSFVQSGFEWDCRLYGDSFRSRVKADRLARRREKKISKLHQAYSRLADLKDVSDQITREIFSVYSLPENLRDRYLLTHKIVGPKATITNEYVSFFKGPDGVEDDFGYQLRKDGYASVTLATVLCHPEIFQDKLTPDDVARLKKNATVDPNATALEAQNLIRRKTNGNEVVRVGNLNRSRKTCQVLLEEFARHVPMYTQAIEGVFESRWIQMFGPNGIRDWSISSSVGFCRTLRAVYDLVICFGCDIVKLLFENELSVLSIGLVDGVDSQTEPPVVWVPCASDEQYYQLAQPGNNGGRLSTDLLSQEELSLFREISPNVRAELSVLKDKVLMVTDKHDKYYGNAIDFGGSCLLTCEHVASLAIPGFVNRLRGQDVSTELAVINHDSQWDAVWSVREPVVGEYGFYMFVANNEVHYSAPVVVINGSKDYVSTSDSAVIGKGCSGCALVAMTDASLLGVFTAKCGEQLMSVKMTQQIRYSVYHLFNGSSAFSIGIDTSLSMSALTTCSAALEESFIEIEHEMYFSSGKMMINCSGGVDASSREIILSAPVQRKPSRLNFHLDRQYHIFFLLYVGGYSVMKSGINRADNLENILDRLRKTVPDLLDIVLVVSPQDCAILSIKVWNGGTWEDLEESLTLEVGDTNNIISEISSLSCYDEVFGRTDALVFKQQFIRSFDALCELSVPNDLLLIAIGAVEEVGGGINRRLLLDLLDFHQWFKLFGEVGLALDGWVPDDSQQRLGHYSLEDRFLLKVFIILCNYYGIDSFQAFVVHVKIKLEMQPA